MTDTPSTAAPAESEREIAFEQLISGRLALQVLRNQLDTQIVGLEAQLVIAQAHLRRTEDMLRRTDEKLARHHPEVATTLAVDVERARPRGRH